MAKPSKTATEAGKQITRDTLSWSKELDTPTKVTWAFRDSLPFAYISGSNKEGDSFSRMKTTQMEAVRDALGAFSDVAGVTFEQHSSNGKTNAYTNNATILFANYNNGKDGAGGFAWQPGAYFAIKHALGGDRRDGAHDGDVWVNLDSNSVKPQIGSYEFGGVLLHEVGHALGLDHPGNYAAESGKKFNYTDHASYAEDTRQYTVMSYFDASAKPKDGNHSYTNPAGKKITVYAGTLLMHDIAAIQRLYGKNTAIRTGDTSYGFNFSKDILDGYRIAKSDQQVVFCVYEGGGGAKKGGVDTLDFSKYAENQTINLTAGSFSSVGKLKKNVSIAQGTVIENAIGGAGNDVITGNGVANVLTGGRGNDTLDGGGGVDTASFKGELSVSVTLANGNATARSFNTLGGKLVETKDTLKSIENLVGTAGIDTLIGDAKSNRIDGGAGNDSIKGGGAVDTLNGEGDDDTIQGGAGVDILDGGAGFDILDLSDKTVAVEVSLTTGTKGGIAYIKPGTVLVAEDRFTNFEGVRGGKGNDVLRGTGDKNTLEGGAGNDTLYGNGGADLLDGGADTDTVSFEHTTLGFVVSLDAAGDGLVTGSGLTGTRLKGIESIIGGSGGNYFGANAKANTFNGGGGSDTVAYTYITNPKLSLVARLDANGDAVFAVYDTSMPKGVMVDQDTVTSIENITGGAGNDFLVGNARDNALTGGDGDDRLKGGEGLDRLDGGAGNNTAEYYDRMQGIVVRLEDTGETTVYNAGTLAEKDKLVSVQNIFGSFVSDFIRGNNGVNTISGGGGGDILSGGGGVDIIDGGTEEDTIDYSDMTTGVILDLTAGKDGIYNVAYTQSLEVLDKLYSIENMIGGSGNDIFLGGNGKHVFTGNAGSDTFIFSGAIHPAFLVTLTDFKSGIDKLHLDDRFFDAFAGATGALPEAHFTQGASAFTDKAGPQIIFNTSNGGLYYDRDGVDGDAAVQFAVLNGTSSTSLSASDFTIV